MTCLGPFTSSLYATIPILFKLYYIQGGTVVIFSMQINGSRKMSQWTWTDYLIFHCLAHGLAIGFLVSFTRKINWHLPSLTFLGCKTTENGSGGAASDSPDCPYIRLWLDIFFFFPLICHRDVDSGPLGSGRRGPLCHRVCCVSQTYIVFSKHADIVVVTMDDSWANKLAKLDRRIHPLSPHYDVVKVLIG